jgi:hypothetical protein
VTQATPAIAAGVWQTSWNFQPAASFASKPASAEEAPYDDEHVNIPHEVDKALMKASEKGGIDALFKVVEEHGEDFNEGNVTTAFHELAKVVQSGQDKENVHVNETFQTLVDMVILGRRRFSATQLTSIVKSAADLGFDEEALLDKLGQALITKVDRLEPQEVVDLVTGLASAEHSPSVVLFDAIQKRAEAIAGGFSDEQKAQLDQAYAKLDLEYKDITKKL